MATIIPFPRAARIPANWEVQEIASATDHGPYLDRVREIFAATATKRKSRIGGIEQRLERLLDRLEARMDKEGA